MTTAQAPRDVPVEIFQRADAAAGGTRPPLPTASIDRLIDALRPEPACRALVWGAGTGYAVASLAPRVREVCAVEWVPALAALAERTLSALGLANVRLKKGEAQAFRERAPFQLILVPLGVPEIPPELKEQLAVGGRLTAAVGRRRKRQILTRLTRLADGRFHEERLGELRFEKRLGDLLVEAGAADRTQVEEAAARASAEGGFLGDLLHRVSKVSEEEVARALAVQRGLRFGVLDDLMPLIEPDVARALPREFLDHHKVIPLRRRGGRLELATRDPEIDLEELAKFFQPEALDPWLVTPTAYARLWEVVDRKGGSAAADDERRFVEVFEAMLLDAVGERSSDIHLERYGELVRTRFRVDGDLRDITRYRLSPSDLLGLINVIKIRSNLDIAEHRLPQGGRFRISVRNGTYDLRVQIQPSLHGEHAVIRLLPQEVKILTVEDLGFDAELADEYRRLLDQPAGLVLVVGPTGSGKTTTLYAGLQILARDASRKVITVEDPIEYAIDRVQQTAVRPEIGFSFADAMRSFVRQDPDVILVGEIRDSETALEAIRASQTGHLVFSTLHCNDSTDAVQRLIDLGMHPNSIGSELLAVISQRLAKRICEGCKREAAPDPKLAAAVFPGGLPAGFRCWRGSGCPRCGGHGSYGRIACVEFLRADTALRAAISLRPPVGELRRQALRTRLVPLRESALALVRQGKIVFEDLPTLLSWERLAPER